MLRLAKTEDLIPPGWYLFPGLPCAFFDAERRQFYLTYRQVRPER